MYVIIGATSFIGVYTIQEFIKHGEKIVVTARNDKFRKYYEQFDNVEYINFDLNNPDDINKLPKENVDGVILISALLPATEDADLSDTENADKYIITNTLGTINILEYCRKNKIKRLISTVSYADISAERDQRIPALVCKRSVLTVCALYGDGTLIVVRVPAGPGASAFFDKHAYAAVAFYAVVGGCLTRSVGEYPSHHLVSRVSGSIMRSDPGDRPAMPLRTVRAERSI